MPWLLRLRTTRPPEDGALFPQNQSLIGRSFNTEKGGGEKTEREARQEGGGQQKEPWTAGK